MVGMSVVSLPQPADDMGYPSASGSSNKAPGNGPVNYSEVYCADSIGAQCPRGTPQAWQGLTLVCINPWPVVGIIGEKKLLCGEPRMDRGQARFPQTSLKMYLQKLTDLALASGTSLGIVSSLCRPLRENQHLGPRN